MKRSIATVSLSGTLPEKLEAMRAALDALQRNETAQIED